MKGWQTNAAQQKYNGSAVPPSSSPTPNQASANMKSRAASTAPGGESDTHDRHMHDRTLYLLTKLMVNTILIFHLRLHPNCLPRKLPHPSLVAVVVVMMVVFLLLNYRC